MIALRAALFGLVGLAFGSFLTVVTHRVPRGESLVAPRSRCPSCGTQLRNIDNIPVVSWVFLRGRCRSCRARISPVYPLTELATGGLFVAAALEFDRIWAAAMMAPFLGLMVALSIIDLRHRIIPNRIVLPATVLVLVANTARDLSPEWALAALAVLGTLKPGDLATEKPYLISNRNDKNVKCVAVEKPLPACAP